ncbi:MAG TPA: UDP-4-amino-4,6-dideoxy-N-acetyl-beta-L-altrosamine transaminase [Caulobacteraceae bacterium]|jgi:UDP-4-amino-4,6-dideoxy-N-acetyl-beta-L-altrosamine transaminase
MTDSLPYGLHLIEDDDVAAVTAALTSGLLAQGPRAQAFEAALAERLGAAHAVTASSGTAALHLALAGLDVGPGDLVVVPAITFLSTATAVRMCGAEVVFADVDPETGLMTPETFLEALAGAPGPVKVGVPVHLGGRLVDMAGVGAVAAQAGVVLVEDCAHAIGSRRGEERAGACARSAASCFSFHPVKTIAAGEGGAVTTNDAELAARIGRLRNHGVTREEALLTDPELSLDPEGRRHPWSYEQLELGFNYRMTDLEAALGLSQLNKLDRFVARRAALAAAYDRMLEPLAPWVRPVRAGADEAPSLHLYQVLIDFGAVGKSRDQVARALIGQGIGCQVHYIPLYRQPYFKARYGPIRLPGSEAFYAGVLALPLFPAMADADVERVLRALAATLTAD